MKVLALDISSTCTGIAKYEYNENTKDVEFISVSSIKPKGKNLYERLHKLHIQMEEEDLYSWGDLVVIEGFAFGGSKLAQMAIINGIVRYNLYIKDKQVVDIAPSSVKKRIAGNGKAKKEEVRDVLKRMDMFKDLEFNNEDESDACAIGLAYLLDPET